MGIFFSKPNNRIDEDTDCQQKASYENAVEVTPVSNLVSAPEESVSTSKSDVPPIPPTSLALDLPHSTTETSARSSTIHDSHRPASASVTTEVTFRSEDRRPHTSFPSGRRSKVEHFDTESQPSKREAWGDGDVMVGPLESPDTHQLETSSEVSTPKSPKKERLKKKLEKEKNKRDAAEKRYNDSLEQIKALERDLALRKEEIDGLNNK